MISISLKLAVQDEVRIHFPTALRKLAVVLFVVGIIPFIAQGIDSHEALPAAGIAILFASAVVAILDLASRGVKLGGEGKTWIKKALLLLADLGLMALDLFMIIISYVTMTQYGWYRVGPGVAIFGTHCIFFLYADLIIHIYFILHCFAGKKEQDPMSAVEEGRPARFQPYTDADARDDAEAGEPSQGVTEASIDASKN